MCQWLAKVLLEGFFLEGGGCIFHQEYSSSFDLILVMATGYLVYYSLSDRFFPTQPFTYFIILYTDFTVLPW